MAGDNDDIKSKIKVTEQLNAVFEKQRRLLESTTREMNAQYEIMTKMRQAVEAAGDLGDPLKKAKDAKAAIDDLAKSHDDAKDSATAHTDALKEGMEKSESSAKNFTEALKKASKQFPVMKTAALATTHGIIEGFRAATNMTSMVMKGVTTLIGGFAKLSLAILSIPFKIFDNLVKKAESGGGGNELAAAYEAVRKQFGDFRQDAAHNVLETAHTIDKEFTQTGLSTWRVFGNLAERIQLVNKVATAMGATFDVVGKQFAEHAGHILAYQKGLGVADENMKDFAQTAIVTGKPMQEVFRETASLSLAMQKQFGGSAKLYSRDISKMINDVKHFGGVSQKTMVEVAVYTRKLGVETDKLLASLDKFDTFDQAAESAAKLAQTYGLQIDAFKLMSAESPADQADMIKKAFQEQGVAVDQLDRKNLKYIASLTGWDEATTRTLLSSKNMGVSLDKIKEGSAKAEKQQLSQAEAMQKLAGAIERLTPSGNAGFGGFIKALIKGFSDGIEWSKEFLQIMVNIRRDLYTMYYAGRKIGAEFVKSFPGIKDFFGGIAELFNPTRFQKLADGLVEVFTKFFSDLKSNPKMALGELMKHLREKFFNFLDGEKPGGSKLLDGLKKFGDAAKYIIAGSIKFVMDSLTQGFGLIKDLISGKGIKEIGAGASGVKKIIADFMSPIADAIKEAWPALRDAFVGLLQTAWEKLKSSGLIEKLWDGLKKYMLGVGVVALGAGATKGGGALVLGAASKAVGSFAAGMIGKFFENNKKALVEAASTASKVPATGGGIEKLATALPERKSGESMVERVKGLEGGASLKDKLKGIVPFLVGFAGVVAIGMVALWAAIKLFGDVPLEKLMKGLLVVGGAATALLPAAGAIALLGKVKVDPKSAAIGIAAVGLGVAAMAMAIGAIYGAFSLFKVDFGKLGSFTDVILQMSKVFAVTGLVVMEAMVIGALITATSGLAGAAALAGFATIGAGVAAMAASAATIMKSLESISFANGMKDKVDAFVKILTGVTDFAKVYSDILTAAKPSFTSLLFGASKSTKEDLDAVTKFVESMIGPPGGMIGLVQVLLSGIEKLANGKESTLKSAEVFGNLLSAVATLAGSIAPPKELFDNSFKLIETGDATRNALQGSADYVKTIESSLVSIVDKVKGFLQFMKTQGITEEQMRTAAGVGQLFQAIATITVALRPDPNLISAAKDANGSIKDNVLDKVGDVVRAQGNQIKNVVEAIAASVMPAIKSLSTLDKSQIQTLQAVAPLLTSIFQTTTGVSQAFTGILLSKNINTDLNTRSNLINRMMTSVGEMIKGVGEQLPGIFDSVSKVPKVAEKGAITEVKNSLKVVRDLVGELNALTDILGNDKLMKIDVGAKLTELTKRVGLGGEGTYTIKNSPVTITVNLKVEMDAKQIDHALVDRQGTSIQFDAEKRKHDI